MTKKILLAVLCVFGMLCSVEAGQSGGGLWGGFNGGAVNQPGAATRIRAREKTRQKVTHHRVHPRHAR